jgi:serine protease Do
MRRIVTASSIVVGLAIAIGCGVAGTRAEAAAPKAQPGAAPQQQGQIWREGGSAAGAQVPQFGSLAPLIRQLKPAVVNVSTTTVMKNPHGGLRRGPRGQPDPRGGGDMEDFFEFFGRPQPDEFRGQSLGSGFILSADGYILTNNHVVKDATEITVRLSDGKELPAKVVGADPATDVGLIKLDSPPPNLPTVALGDSDKLEQGDFVVAIGSPFGLRESATFGMISAKERTQVSGSPFDDFLQTDAAINSGNSGGPLFNLRGEVVGINTAIVAPQIGSGIGFAVPINIAKQLIPQLLTGKVARGYVGVSVSELTPDLAQAFGVPPDTKGAVVQNVVQGGPASKAGVQAGDIVVAVNGKEVVSSAALTRAVSAVTPGQRATITVLRNGKKQDLNVTVAKRPDEEALARGELTVEPEETPAQGEAKRSSSEKLGMRVTALTPELARELGVEGDQGVVVAAVTPDGPAAKAGLRRGDVILELNRKPVARVEDMVDEVKKMKAGDMALLRVRRGSGAAFYAVKVGGEEAPKPPQKK